MKNNLTGSDVELIELYQENKDEQIVVFLMEKYTPLICKCVQNYFLQGAEYQDLLQEAKIAFFEALDKYDKTRNLSFPEFAKICIHRAVIDAIKKTNRKKHEPLNGSVSIELKEQEEEKSYAESPEDLVLQKEFMKELRNRLDQELSAFEKLVLSDYMEGLDYQEIAAKREKTPKAIDNALQRIKKKVRLLKL